jgi:hypothetical protein
LRDDLNVLPGVIAKISARWQPQHDPGYVRGCLIKRLYATRKGPCREHSDFAQILDINDKVRTGSANAGQYPTFGLLRRT